MPSPMVTQMAHHHHNASSVGLAGGVYEGYEDLRRGVVRCLLDGVIERWMTKKLF